MAIVYQHRRKDTNEIFYVGIGVDVHRAVKKQHRNIHWQRIVALYGYEIEIIETDCSYEKAREIEIAMIAEIGRRDLGKGPLVNMTNGGEGTRNRILSKDSIEKSRNSKIGEKNPYYGKKHSIEARTKISKSNSKPHTEERKKNISLSKIGKKITFEKVECPYCNKIGSKNLMMRYHFNKCKLFTKN